MGQAAVAHGLQRQRRQADVRIDQAGRQRQEGGVAQQDAIDLVAHGPGRADGDFRADAGRLAAGDGDGRAAAGKLLHAHLSAALLVVFGRNST
jgi:hypothetical protein